MHGIIIFDFVISEITFDAKHVLNNCMLQCNVAVGFGSLKIGQSIGRWLEYGRMQVEFPLIVPTASIWCF
jgi:hypothetical protein